jgi:hypothetical protein
MTWERKILRKIYGPIKENGQWRIKTNLELMTKYKSQDIVTVIRIQRLEWIGHIRMNETRSVKKIFEGKLEGRRGRGRPRLRWIDDMEDNLRMLGVKRLRAKALAREEWASIIREAKAKLKEQCYRKKKKEWTRSPRTPPVVKGFIWYTDGSRTAEGTGAGVYGQSVNRRLNIPLGKHATVF